ncbi:MAG: ATP synthase subunit I [Clostridiales bacterium]|jgi:F1F0 ATPase subunit 2|nr:ATP synthase subunit I [Clostridiales bacterium]
MNDALGLVLALLSGISLGAFFFGGLWWTTRKAPSVRRPALWFLGSFFLRSIVVLAGFWLVGAGQWQRLMLCLGGFVAARFIINMRLRATAEKQVDPVGEDHYEAKS